jgi:hypothetical protein
VLDILTESCIIITMRDAKPDRLMSALRKIGFVDNGGSKHALMVNPETGGRVAIPKHGIIKRNTVERIRKDGLIDKKTFYAFNF